MYSATAYKSLFGGIHSALDLTRYFSNDLKRKNNFHSKGISIVAAIPPPGEE